MPIPLRSLNGDLGEKMTAAISFLIEPVASDPESAVALLVASGIIAAASLVGGIALICVGGDKKGKRGANLSENARCAMYIGGFALVLVGVVAVAVASIAGGYLK